MFRICKVTPRCSLRVCSFHQRKGLCGFWQKFSDSCFPNWVTWKKHGNIKPPWEYLEDQQVILKKNGMILKFCLRDFERWAMLPLSWGSSVWRTGSKTNWRHVCWRIFPGKTSENLFLLPQCCLGPARANPPSAKFRSWSSLVWNDPKIPNSPHVLKSTWLGGGFNFFSLPGEMILFDFFFSDGLKPPSRWTNYYLEPPIWNSNFGNREISPFPPSSHLQVLADGQSRDSQAPEASQTSVPWWQLQRGTLRDDHAYD